METALEGTDVGDVEAQAFVTPAGRKLLLVNKRDRAIDISMPDGDKGTAMTVDVQSGDDPARSANVAGGKLRLEPFAVTVVKW